MRSYKIDFCCFCACLSNHQRKEREREREREHMLLSLRWLITTALFHAALLYAAFVALRPQAAVTSCPSSKETLKLWMILGTITAFSDTLGFGVCSWVPLFYELRCVFVWGLIVLEPKAWGHFYDVVLSPSAGFVLSKGHEVKSSFPIRRLMHLLVVVMGSAFVVLLEAAVSTGAISKEVANVDLMIQWMDRIQRSAVAAVAPLSPPTAVVDEHHHPTQQGNKDASSFDLSVEGGDGHHAATSSAVATQ